MANGRGPLATAAASIPAPPTGSAVGDLSTAAAAFVAGLMQRRKEKREEARRDALLKLQQDAAKRAERQLEISEAQLELTREQAAQAALERAQDEETRPALITIVEDYSRRLNRPLDRASLQNMPIDRLSALSNSLRAELLGMAQLQAQQRSNELLERQQILQELQRVEDAIAQARQLRQNIAGQLQQQSVGLWQEAGQLSRAENISLPDAFQRVFNERLEAEMQRVGGPGANLRALMDQAAAMRAELGRLRGVGGVPATADVLDAPFWSTLDAAQRTAAEQEFKRRFPNLSPEWLEQSRMAGWPVDAWIFELQQGAVMGLGGMPFEQMIQQQQQSAAQPFPLGQRSSFNISGAPTLPLRSAPQPQTPQQSPFTLPNFFQLGTPDPVLSQFEQQAGLRRRPGPQNPPLPPVR